LLSNRQILIKSFRLSIILNIVNVILSLVLSKVYSGGFETGQISEYVGNITLLETMLMFLYGGAVDFTSSVKWSSAMRFLRIPPRHKGDEENIGEHNNLDKNRKKELDIEKSRSGERMALVYIICGAILLAELVVLAIING